MPEPQAPSPKLTNTRIQTSHGGGNPGVVLDQCLGGEELEKLTFKEGNLFDNDLPRTSHIYVFDDFQLKKN